MLNKSCIFVVVENFAAMQIMIYRDEMLLTARDDATWRSGLERRFYDDHDRKVDGSTPNLVSLLRPWIRCFTLIVSAW